MEIKSLEDARQILNALQNLVKSPAWERLVEDWQEQIQGREETIHEPLADVQEVYRNEYLKGEVSGLYTAIGYPAVVIEDLKAQIAELSRKAGDDEA